MQCVHTRTELSISRITYSYSSLLRASGLYSDILVIVIVLFFSLSLSRDCVCSVRLIISTTHKCTMAIVWYGPRPFLVHEFTHSDSHSLDQSATSHSWRVCPISLIYYYPQLNRLRSNKNKIMISLFIIYGCDDLRSRTHSLTFTHTHTQSNPVEGPPLHRLSQNKDWKIVW